MIMRPIWYSSRLVEQRVLAGVPMSGSWLASALVSPAACASGSASAAAPASRAGALRRGAPSRIRPCIRARWDPDASRRGTYRASEAKSARRERSPRSSVMWPAVRPAAEAVDDVGQAGGGLGQVGRVDLRDVAQADHLGAGAGARDQRLHLLGRQVLRLVEDDVAVEEGAAAHEVQRADLDAVAQQVVGRRAAPVAAFARCASAPRGCPSARPSTAPSFPPRCRAGSRCPRRAESSRAS